MQRLETAIRGIEAARTYTLQLLEDVGPDDWFRQPTEGVTHLAWQVGHLAMAEYRLALAQTRGQRAEDERILPASYLALFGRGSEPVPDATQYPAPTELRGVFDAVHHRVIEELPCLPLEQLDQPPEREHRIAKTKLGCLEWCAQHEMLHAGQIGLIKRLLGKAPQW